MEVYEKQFLTYDNDDLISVIIPAYNAEKTIGMCIKSILKQTYTNFEIIIIDDGSTDNTKTIIDNYMLKDSRIRYFYKENEGTNSSSSAKNFGLSHMRGSYFIFIDSDDRVKSKLLEKLYINMKENNSDISMCSFIYKSRFRRKKIKCNLEVSDNVEESIKKYLLGDITYGHVCKLFNTKKYKSVKFVEGIVYEDLEYLFRVLLKSEKISNVNYPGYIYYARKNSITRSKFNKKNMDLLKVMEFIDEKVSKVDYECNEELQVFIFKHYISILKIMSEYRAINLYLNVYNEIIKWLKENKDVVKNKSISFKYKFYNKVFIRNNYIFIRIYFFIYHLYHKLIWLR